MATRQGAPPASSERGLWQTHTLGVVLVARDSASVRHSNTLKLEDRKKRGKQNKTVKLKQWNYSCCFCL
jgi:hypothetical protein